MYSHGSAAEPWSSSFFTTHLASYGFVVVAPAHPGNTADSCPSPCVDSNPAFTATLMDDYVNRPGDISDALTQAIALSAGSDSLLAGVLDGSRAGLTGWSLGGNTVIRTLPAATPHGDVRFSAGVALAPLTDGFATTAAGQITVPVMVLAGMLDDQVTFASQQALFSAIPSNGSEDWMIAFAHAGHRAFSDSCPSSSAGCTPPGLDQATAHMLINHWATPFLVRYVAGDTTATASLDPSLAQGNPEITVTRTP